MPLNKLENFIKNTDGRTIYVNPNDLNATDSITNQGTSLTEPFKTIQRALLEAARFSYVRGDDNDLVERTTILVFPGEHFIDNRPGYGLKTIAGNPVAVTPSGQLVDPFVSFNLTSDSNFDIQSTNNILHRYNSIYGGVIVPRGTSIVGLDLRKTKIRPRYVPNPTDPNVGDSAIFRITGSCYFWQFTIFDGDESSTVFTDPRDFSENNRSRPTFSHHKLTAFEYADGVNPAVSRGFDLTDLQMYYSKLSNAFNEASGRAIDEKFPTEPDGFAPQRPEFEIVGAFATDPVNITRIISGDGFTPDTIVTVDTAIDHGLSAGTPIKIRGVSVDDYNISTKVGTVLGPRRFTYLLGFVRPNLPAEPGVSSANVTVETDTVTGASPYIFNVSMRSVWGVNGMHADGAKATGFRSMVVAQFTAISLQKDDRAFVKYNKATRKYNSINFPVSRGGELSQQSSSTSSSRVYHLDPEAVYRPGWDTTHIKMSNDAVIQIVSVFAIGFNNHFAALGGADASITNSNSNFGQFALYSDGFKRDAFRKDDQGFITQIITPRSAFNPENQIRERIEWLQLDFELTRNVGINNHLYIDAFSNREDLPAFVNQGFKLGANQNEKLYFPTEDGNVYEATIRMTDVIVDQNNNLGIGSDIGSKEYRVVSGPTNSTFRLPPHKLVTGETIRVYSNVGDLPENMVTDQLYYAIVIDNNNIRIATSEANAFNGIFVEINGGSDMRVVSRVNDKKSGDPGHPIQYDEVNNNWFVHANPNNQIYNWIVANPSVTESDLIPYFERPGDNRNLDEKLYRFRYVIPKEATNAKPPTPGYVIQASSSTGVRNNDDFILNSITINDYGYKRNEQFIASGSVISTQIELRTEKPHELEVNDLVEIRNITSSDNAAGTYNIGYNGKFRVTQIIDARTFRYSTTDVDGFTRTPGTFTNNTNIRNALLPTLKRKENQINAYIYRVVEIAPYEEGIRDGIYHLFVLNASNAVTETFQDRKYSQRVENLYPQLDRDNLSDNPRSTKTFAKRSPLGDVNIDDPANSITRETVDKFIKANGGNIIASVVNGAVQPNTTYTATITFQREHRYNGVYSFATLTGGSGYTPGTYYNVKLLSNGGVKWKGGSAKVTVVAGAVTGVQITDRGSGYLVGETVTFDNAALGGGTGAQITLNVSSIENSVDDCIQITGGSVATEDIYALITSVVDEKTITITRVNGDPPIEVGSYALTVDNAIPISSYNEAVFGDAEDGLYLGTFTAASNRGFGLQRGNRMIVFNTLRKPIAELYATDLPVPTTLTAVTENQLTNVAFVAKAGLAANDAPTGDTGENIGVRGIQFYDNGIFYLQSTIGSQNTITVRAKDGGVSGIPAKMFLGRYLQVGTEIMRVSSSNVSGASQNVVTVIRGALGSSVTTHLANSKIRAIEPQAIEIRRPSILRASGHTFEYLGYGPGNYSTSLPQLQVRQLPENEVFLVQSQETSAGQVVYTGMSDNGDFYIGNTKYSATSGTQTTFDVPIPTVAGEDGGNLSVVFDEVIVNERLFVAGGETKQILSQFDGPVKFTNNVSIQGRFAVSGEVSATTLRVNGTQNPTTPSSGGALQVAGGMGIVRDLRVGGNIFPAGDIFVDTIDNRQTSIPKIATIYPSSTTINIGNTATQINFTTTVAGTGIGGVDDIANSSGGVNFEGSVMVRKKVIAGEFVGDGIGKPGSVIMWGGSSTNMPRGYLLCDGRYLDRATYPKLFAAIGTLHGTSSGTDFRIPDLRDKFIVGAENNYAVAAQGGANTVALTLNQIPSHDHSVTTVDTSHTHSGSIGNQNANHTHSGSTDTNNAPHSHPASSGSASAFHSHSGSASGNGNHGHPVFDPGHAHNYQSTQGNNRVDTQPSQVDSRRNQVGRTTSYNGAGVGVGAGGFHSHNVSIFGSSATHSHPVSIGGANATHSHTMTTGNNSTSHQHPILINSSNQSHTHNLGNTGGGGAHENRPPYYALCYIIQYQ